MYAVLMISAPNQWRHGSRHEACPSLPWPSFTNITYLDVDIEILVSSFTDPLVTSWTSLSGNTFQVLEEAAKLVTIETLALGCHIPESVLADDEILDAALSDI